MIINHGSRVKYFHEVVGVNSRLDTIQAIILRIKLRTILKLNDHRRKIAKIYDRNLKKISQIRLTKTSPGSSRHLYVIRVKNRDKLIKYLTSKKILCQIHYPYSLNKIRPLLKKIKGYKILRNSEQWSKECLSLPIHSKLKVRQSYRVINEIIKFFNNK